MTFLAKPTMALGFGLFFLCAVTCAHFDQITTAPLGLASDWVHGCFLVVGGLISSRDWVKGSPYQIAAWAATASLFFGSVLGNFEEWRSQPLEGGTAGFVAMSQATYLFIVFVLFVVALAGLIASLRAWSATHNR